jgi:hypothetical protein
LNRAQRNSPVSGLIGAHGGCAHALRAQQLIAFVATRDPGRAKAFCRDILGQRLVSEGQFGLVFDATCRMLRVTAVQEVAAAK